MKRLDALVRHLQGGWKRFGMALFWCAALFLCASAALWERSPFGVSLRILELTAGCAAALAAVWQLREESVSAETPGRWWVSIPAAGALAFYFHWLPEAQELLAAAGIAGACAALGLYFLSRRGGAVFARCLTGALQALGLTALLALSLLLCLWAADALLFEINARWYGVAVYGAVFLAGSQLFLSWLPRGGETVPVAVHAVLCRLLLPVYLVLLAILYGYIGKILVTGEMPVGQMNWFASLAVLGYVFFYFNLGRGESGLMGHFLRFGGAALLPVAAVQLYGVEIRLSAYGLTPLRYASLLCTAFGLAVIAAGGLRRMERALYLLAAALALAATVTPLNLLDLPRRDQEYRAQTVMEAYGMLQEGEIREPARPLTERDEEILAGACAYLRRSYQGEDSFAGQIADSPVLQEISESRQPRYFRTLSSKAGRAGAVDIRGYSRLYPFEGEPIREGMLAIPLQDGAVSYAVGSYIEGLFRQENPPEEMVYEPAPGVRIIFTQCIRYGREDGPMYDVWGYVLVKEGE